MNIETIRSLTEFMQAVTHLVASKGDNPAALKKAKLAMISAQMTEQDLRDMEFQHACQDFYSVTPHQTLQQQPQQPAPEIRKTPVPEVKKAAASTTMVPIPMTAAKSSSEAASASTKKQ